MINMQNSLGTRFRATSSVLVGFALAFAALALLATQASAQEEMAEDAQFTLIGTIVDADTGERLIGAWVGMTGTEWGSITNDEGRFRIPDMTAGTLALNVELIGYEKLDWIGEVDGPDGLVIELAPQAIVLEGLEVVSDRFRSRRNAAATSVFAYDTGDLSTSVAENAVEFIEFNSSAWLTPCNGQFSDRCLFVRGRTVEPTVYVDEAPVLGGLEYLEAFQPWEFHMIEVYGGGRHIRVYTPSYMERAAKNRISPIALPF